MKVFFAGATGAIGRVLLPKLVAAGHQVAAMTRSRAKVASIQRAGAAPIVCDVYDAIGLKEAVEEVRPEAVIHELTDLPQEFDARKLTKAYEANNRVRREGTRNLVDAASASGVRRFVVQSMASWYAPGGNGLNTEDNALWIDAPEPVGAGVRALQYMENLVMQSGFEAVILRYGGFYGTGSWLGRDASGYRLVMKREYPVIGDGSGVYSWIHLEDAADATLAALERASPGIYNVVDDEPSPVREWLPAYAHAIGAKPPRTVPPWLAHLIVGRGFVEWESSIPGASNAKIKRELDWRPRYPSWRTGFAASLG